MNKPASQNQAAYIADLAKDLGVRDADYYLHDAFDKSRSSRIERVCSMDEASEIIDELMDGIVRDGIIMAQSATAESTI